MTDAIKVPSPEDWKNDPNAALAASLAIAKQTETEPTMAANIQPIIDMLSKSGDMTTEYTKAQAAGRTGMWAFWIGLLGTIAATVGAVVGMTTPVGIAAGAVVTVAGVIAQALASKAYSTARSDTKAAAASVANSALTNSTPSSSPEQPKA